MNKLIFNSIICAIFFSCSDTTPKQNEINDLSKELNTYFNKSLLNVKVNDVNLIKDSLFVNFINLDTTIKSCRDYRHEAVLYSYSFYELYDYLKKYKYIQFGLPYKGFNHTSVLWYTKSDVEYYKDLYSRNHHLEDFARYAKTNISPCTSIGIQMALDSLKLGFSDVEFNDEFYELLAQYSFDCNKNIKESKYKKYMVIVALICKHGGEPFKEEYEALKYFLTECDIDTNVLNKKI